MKAIVCPTYGPPDLLQYQEVEKPSPGDKEVLIKVHAASVNAADWHLMRGKPFLVRFMFGLMKPKHKIPGIDAAGRVEAVGKNVNQFQPGDRVFTDLSEAGFGAFAESVCATENAVARIPDGVSFEEAAAVPTAAVTALQGLRDKGQIQSGQKVLINGASGGVGTFAVQIAKSYGAEVTGVCSTGKTDMVQSLGADHVIDYTKENFTQNENQYDLILAANGYHPIRDYKRALTSNGRYVMTGGTNAQMYQALLFGPLLSKKNGKSLGNLMMKPNQEDLSLLTELMADGKVKPVIERKYSLRELPEAIRYVEKGHAKGKIIITVKEDDRI